MNIEVGDILESPPNLAYHKFVKIAKIENDKFIIWFGPSLDVLEKRAVSDRPWASRSLDYLKEFTKILPKDLDTESPEVYNSETKDTSQKNTQEEPMFKVNDFVNWKTGPDSNTRKITKISKEVYYYEYNGVEISLNKKGFEEDFELVGTKSILKRFVDALIG